MRLFKRFAVTIIGAGLLLVGLAMMVLPGPGILLIVAGLAVLATEYVWAQRLLVRARDKAQGVQQAAVASPVRTGASIVFALGLMTVGALTIVVEDVAWPILEPTLDTVWGPVTGSILVITGVVLVTTTVLTIRAARGRGNAYTPPTGGEGRSGATVAR